MAKVAEAVGGAALIALGAGLEIASVGAATPFLPYIFSAGASLTLAGIGGLIAGDPQAGVSVAGNNPIGAWGYVYGKQKVGGVKIFENTNSSQGTSNNKQIHRVYVLDCHTSQPGSVQLRLDGQIVPMNHVGTVNGADQYVSYTPTQTTVNITSAVRSGGLVTVTLASAITLSDGQNMWFQSLADNTFNGTFIVAQTGPTTLTYTCGGADTTTSGGKVSTTLPDYGNKVYMEVQYGTQTATFQGLLDSGTQWSATDICKGKTVVYLRMGYDDATFGGGIPNASWVLQGKDDLLDPRTGTRGWTDNAALVMADFMSLAPAIGGFGLAIGTNLPGLYVDEAQLVAAANICDERVNLAAGGTQARYTCNTYVTLSMTRGAILTHLAASCAGRITREGGAYKIFPAAWPGSTFSVTLADLRGPVQMKPIMSARDIFNGVKGVFVAEANNYQQADIPPYAQDVLHGYASDANQAFDGGDRIWRDVQFTCTDNAPMAQRLAKVELLRARYQNRLTLHLSMRAWTVVAQDVIDVTLPRYNWETKFFEVMTARTVFVKGEGESVPAPHIELDLAETDPSIYDWFTTEELTVQGYVSPAQSDTSICPYPESLEIYSGPGATINGIVCPSTIRTTASGVSTNSLWVTWTAPNDGYVLNGGSIEVQFRKSTDTNWSAFASFDPGVTSCFIPNLSDGDVYYVRIRAKNCAGTPSNWVEAGPETISSTLSLLAYSGVEVAPDGTLTGLAFSDGTGGIAVSAFTAKISSQTASCTPSVTPLTGLNQGQYYEVYYVDPYFLGGSITPVATQNPADYLNKVGHFLIGTLTIPRTGSAVYQPSTYSDFGTSSTATPEAAYSNNPLYAAQISGFCDGTNSYRGNCRFFGFPDITPSGDTLYVQYVVQNMSGGSPSVQVAVSFNGGAVLTTEFTATSDTSGLLSVAIPSGTDLDQIQVVATATPDTTVVSSAEIDIFNIYVGS